MGRRDEYRRSVNHRRRRRRARRSGSQLRNRRVINVPLVSVIKGQQGSFGDTCPCRSAVICAVIGMICKQEVTTSSPRASTLVVGRLGHVEERLSGARPGGVGWAEMDSRGDSRVLIGTAGEERFQIGHDVVEVLCEFWCLPADRDMDHQSIRQRLYRQGEHVRADESQRSLTGLEKKVGPPKQHLFLIFSEIWAVVLLSGVHHGHMVHQAEQPVSTRRQARECAGYTQDETALKRGPPVLRLSGFVLIVVSRIDLVRVWREPTHTTMLA